MSSLNSVSIFSVVTAFSISLSVIFVIIGALIGLCRRTYRSTISIASSVLAIILAVLFTIIFCKNVIPGNIENAEALDDLVEGVSVSDFVASSEATKKILTVYLAAFSAPAMFLVFWFISKLVLLIPAAIVRGILKRNETSEYRASKMHKGIGAAIGAVAGLILILPFNFMLASYAGMVGNMYNEMADGIEEAEFEGAEMFRALGSDGQKGFSVWMYETCTKPLVKNVSTVEYEGETENFETLNAVFARSVNLTLKALNSFPEENEAITSDKVDYIIDNVIQSCNAMSESALLRNAAPDIIEYVINDPDMNKDIPIDKEVVKDLTDALRKNDGTAEKLLNTTKKAAAIATELSSEEIDANVLSENIGWLAENMDESVAETVKKSVKSFKIFGSLSENTAGKLTDAISNLCDRLAAADKMSDDESKKTAEALVDLYDIGTKATTSGKQNAMFEEVLPSAERLISDLCDSEIIASVIKDLVYDKDGNAIENPLGEPIVLGENDKTKLSAAIESYKSSHETADAKALSAISVIFGLN